MTGQLDADTQAALASFQADRALPRSGAVDPDTWVALAGLAAEQAPTGAVAVTFAYDSDWWTAGRSAVQLQGVAAIDGSPGLSDDVGPADDLSGAWVEWQDAQGGCLFRRFLHEPIALELELPGEGTDATDRAAIDHPRGAFTVVLPVLPAAARLVLFSSPLALARRGEPAAELASFDASEVV
jgi:hypothetical protein